jgi:hypothetical protein
MVSFGSPTGVAATNASFVARKSSAGENETTTLHSEFFLSDRREYKGY